MSIKVVETLSTALCGEGFHPEIFISCLALGANQTSKLDYARIYGVHNEFLDDVSHLLLSVSASIGDTDVTEFFDSGETISRTPRQWAKSLIYPDGMPLEVDLENGGAHDGKTVLVVPSASLVLAKTELQNYWKRRNPTLSHAAKLYKESMLSHPDITTTVFTKNIATILSKTIKKQQDAPTEDSSTAFSPLSSLTGGSVPGTTTTHLKGAIAWRKPLQETLLLKDKATAQTTSTSSAEINQLKKIAILEAQLELRSGTSSVESHASKSAKSKASRSSSQSGLTAASAHSRLDKYETSLLEIKDMLKQLTVTNNKSLAALAVPLPLVGNEPLVAESISTPLSPAGHGMKGVQLFPETHGCTSLVLLGTPTKAHPSKRRKAATTPTQSPTSNLSLHYDETTGSSGGDPC
jgi:hypothetical protein